jgi:hypothetical protein
VTHSYKKKTLKILSGIKYNVLSNPVIKKERKKNYQVNEKIEFSLERQNPDVKYGKQKFKSIEIRFNIRMSHLYYMHYTQSVDVSIEIVQQKLEIICFFFQRKPL